MSTAAAGPSSPRAFRPETIAARCPGCGSQVSGEVVTIVDAANDIERSALLGGRLNVLRCPACNQPVIVEVPLLYFDTEAEIALLHLPGAMGVSREESERAVGRLTNRVIDALPPDLRKSYLLQPRTFSTSRSFLEALFEANGVSADDLRRARLDSALVEELAGLREPEQLRQRLQQEGRLDDVTLPRLAAAMAEAAAADDDDDRGTRLSALADRLASIVGSVPITFEELLDSLHAARESGALVEAVAGLRPVLDYAFFAELTRRAEAAEGPRARQLTDLRHDLLTISDDLDALAAAELERANDTMRAILEADDLAAAVRRRARALDGPFLTVLDTYVRNAGRTADAGLLQRLETIRQIVLEAFEARMPPRARLVNQLARAAAETDIQRLLDESREVVDAELLAAIRSAIAETRRVGADEMARRLDSAAVAIERRLRPDSEALR